MSAYDIVRPLGQGGMGTVYVAVQKELGREVALKLLPRTAASEPALVARFQREMKLIGGLAHPNIVRVFDWGQIEDQLYYAMELFRGHDLSKEKPGDFARARGLLEQAADAIAYLHERQLFHRDIKPSNFVVVEPAHLTLIDFGLARLKEGTLLTEDGAVVGTLRFLPPEAVQGGAAEAPGDVYALAATAHELISGKPLIPPASLPEMVARIVSSQRPPLSGVPPAFAELQTRALAVDPAARPTAVEYRDALRALADASHSGAVRTPRPAPPPRAPRPPEPRSGGAARTLAAALAVCLLVNIALLGALFVRAPQKHVPATSPPPSPVAAASPEAAVPLASRAANGLRGFPAAFGEVPPEVLNGIVRLIRTLRCFPTDHSVYLDLDYVLPETATVEVGRWSDGAVLATRPGPTLNCLQTEIIGLAPDTDHFVRARSASGAVLLHDYRFRTLSTDHTRQLALDTDSLDPTQSGLEKVFARALEHPDPRYGGPAVNYLRSMPPGEAAGLSAISAFARCMRMGGLAHHVFLHTSRLTGTALHSEGIRTMFECRAPVGENPLGVFPETKDPHLFESGRFMARGEAGFSRMLKALRLGRLDLRAGYDLAAIGPELVYAAASRTAGEPLAVRAALAVALGAIGTDQAAVLLDAHLRGPDIPAAHIAHLLGAINTPLARVRLVNAVPPPDGSEDQALVALAALQRAGPIVAIDGMAALVTAKSPTVRREAVAALASSGELAAVPVFEKALDDPVGEVSSRAAWALGLRSDKIPAADRARLAAKLRAFAKTERNVHGLAWWALARIEGATAIPELEAELGRSIKEPDTMGIAWGLAELGATRAVPALEWLAASVARPASSRDMCRFAADLISGRLPFANGTHFVTLPAGVGALRTEIPIAPGQSAEFTARGWWGFKPSGLQPATGSNPGELVIAPSVGTALEPLGRASRRLIAPRRCDVVIAGLGGLPVPESLRELPPAYGFAVVTIAP